MAGFVHFSNFLIPSEKYYRLQSLDHPVSSARIVSNNILIIYMTLLKKTLHLASFMDNSYLTLKEARETKEK